MDNYKDGKYIVRGKKAQGGISSYNVLCALWSSGGSLQGLRIEATTQRVAQRPNWESGKTKLHIKNKIPSLLSSVDKA